MKWLWASVGRYWGMCHNQRKSKHTVFVALAFLVMVLFFLSRPFVSVHVKLHLPGAENDAEINPQLSRLQGFLDDDGTIRRGRSAKDGDWYRDGGTYEVYVFSAFYDDRPSLGSLPVIRVIGVTEELPENFTKHCLIWYPSNKGNSKVTLEPQDIGAGVGRHGKTFKEYIFSCQLANRNIPESVSIVLSSQQQDPSKLRVPIEIPDKNLIKNPFGVCVSVTYWKHDPHRIVEWMEIQKILGVNHVTIYNNSLAPESVRVFQHYAAEGFVDFRQSHSFLPDSGETTIHLHMSPVINDCIYRNMHRFHKILVIDLDEMIIPHGDSDLQSLLGHIDSTINSKHEARSYVFRNGYFFLELPADKTEPLPLVTLSKRHRLPVSDDGYSVKSIIDPLSCVRMHNHYCWGVTKLHDTDGHEIFVDPSLGFNHHYKNCHFDTFSGVEGKCKKLLKTAVQDDTMLKFRAKLLHNVNLHLRQLNLKSFYGILRGNFHDFKLKATFPRGISTVAPST